MIRFFVCILIVLGVGTSAFAATYDVHEKTESSSACINVLHEHTEHSAAESTNDHCVNHCSLVHILNISLDTGVVLNPQVKQLKQQWYFLTLSESNYSNRFWRPPTFNI